MKRSLLFVTAVLASFTLLFQSCMKDNCTQEVTYIVQDPVYMTTDEIRNADIEAEAPRELENPGKIYFYNDLVLINELREGIHVIDNQDPKNPHPIAFISIPGNVDMAVRNGYLYADNFIDLLTLDISDPMNTTLINRSEDVFPPLWDDQENERLLVYYEQRPVTEVVDCDDWDNNVWRGGGLMFEASFDQSVAVNSSSNNTGVGGSMARFTISQGHLYTVDNNSLRVFDLGNPQQPSQAETVQVGWGIETIFPYEDKLFIGSNSGMFIYDNVNPLSPEYLSSLSHATACDPVFVKDNYAYVTLRSGNWCNGVDNQLDLVDISDLRNPKLEKSFNMDNPHGLSIDDNNLFLCEGKYGLKVFDISDPLKLHKNEIDHKTNMHAYDVIVVPNQEKVLLLIGDDGFYQYDFSNPKNLKLLSKLTVQ